jgi:hypothetical protein
MSKGLAIARAFYRSGHHVIGADVEPHSVFVSGRFSVAIEKFYRLANPSMGDTQDYIDSLLDIIEENEIELWVSCSGVASAVEDALAAEAVEKYTHCKAIQFGAGLMETLHNKHSFIENTRKLGLNVPETYLVTSVQDAMSFLYPEELKLTEAESSCKRYIMKSVGLDDSIRADMTLLPRDSHEESVSYISRLQPSRSSPFVLQQFIDGPEYCTHSLIIHGRVLAFTACRSAELLMHYKGLPASSPIFQAMLQYTELYAQKTGSNMTGHFPIDFLLDENADDADTDLLHKIYPVDCNPRVHTAVVLFTDDSEEMAEAYLSILPNYRPPPPSYQSGHSSGTRERGIITPSTTKGHYWIGHDIVTRIILPMWFFLTGKYDIWTFLASWVEALEHVLFWKDGTFEIWDPWPAWWLYCGYWPGMFVVALLTRRWWSRCNVSTTKMFAC